jgi:hypothetical protein
MSHDDFDFEPVPGLPAALPRGETLLWQGTPSWKSLAVRAYHARKVAAYFAVLVLWRIGNGLNDGNAPTAVLLSCLWIIALGAVAIGVLSLLAYLNARSTVYSITSRRILMRHGVAVPLTLNLPFRFIDNAELRTFSDGTGDISLTLTRRERLGYLISWPHLRPGRFAQPQPAFRGLEVAHEAAQILGAALAEEAGCEVPRIEARPTAPAADRLRPVMPGGRPAGAALS